jgi:adenosylhomocysteine nucleosidase
MSQTPPLETPRPGGLILVCFAVREESRFFSSANQIEDQVQVLVTGIGRKNAARALEYALAKSSPELVLTCGFAGGLRSGLPVGTVVYAEDEGTGLATVLSELGAVPVSFHCSSRIATTAVKKRQLRETTGADVVEMESGIIRQICRERKIPSTTIRVISDAAEEDLPLDFNALMTAQGELQYPKLAWALLRSPGKVADLLRLQRQTRQAAQNLGRTLQELLRRKWGGARRLDDGRVANTDKCQ